LKENRKAHEICGILLAAGRSTRFGADKLLHPLPDGTPIAAASARAMLSVLHRIVAVVRPDSRDLIDLFAREGVATVLACEAEEGIGSSLSAAVAATNDAPGWIVALADMPYIRPATYSLVVNALAAGSELAAPVYRGRRGHPVGFSSRFRDALTQLRGDEGAQVIVRQSEDLITRIAVDDPGILFDIDLPEDLR
jgi:molybdenum cofactor cytidylyltransferase